MSIKLHSEYEVCNHLLTALINDDYSGTTDEDDILIAAWVKKLPAGHTIEPMGDHSGNYKTCEISGKQSECETVNIWIPTTEQ